MGCVCCSLSSFVSILLHALERITLCTVCAMLVCCLLFTVVSVLVMGIGIGYHYCTVQNSVEGMEKAAKSAGALRSGGGGAESALRSVNQAVKRGFAHRLGKRDRADAPMPSNNNTINDKILFGKNFTETLHRVKRAVTSGPVPINDTTLLVNLTTANSTFDDYLYDEKLNFNTSVNMTEFQADAPVANRTIHDIKMMRQNCSLLTFFNRFF